MPKGTDWCSGLWGKRRNETDAIKKKQGGHDPKKKAKTRWEKKKPAQKRPGETSKKLIRDEWLYVGGGELKYKESEFRSRHPSSAPRKGSTGKLPHPTKP